MFAIVDPYSTGKYLAQAFRKRGAECLHIASTPEPPRGYATSPVRGEDFVASLFFGGSVEELAAQISRDYDIQAVIAGSDPGVRLANSLSVALKCEQRNVETLGDARRDKYSTQERLTACGLASIKQCKTNELAVALTWAEAHGSYPIVVKPNSSAGSEDVYFCTSQKDVAASFNTIFNKINCTGERNDVVVLQECLVGDEYVVNCVSSKGHHFISDVWLCSKSWAAQRTNVAETEILCAPTDPKVARLADYSRTVLDALGVCYGPSHLEIMFCEHGPVLIEFGCRAQGSIHPDVVTDAVGENQIDLTVQAFLDPEGFAARADHPYRLRKWMIHHFLLSPVTGIYKGLGYESALTEFESFRKKTDYMDPGTPIHVSDNLDMLLGILDFSHEDQKLLHSEYQQFLSMNTRYWDTYTSAAETV